MDVADDPAGLLSEKHHAFAEKVASYTAIVINRARVCGQSPSGENREEESIGIGSACLWNGKKVIVTAKHVVEGACPSDLRFFIRQDGKIDWQVKPNLPPIGLRISLEVAKIVLSSSDDLAAIVLSECPERFLDFIPIPRAFAKAPPGGKGVLLYGCPYDQRIPISATRHGAELHVGYAVQPRGCWAIVEGKTPQHFPSSFNPARHFLLHYDPSEEGALPHGFSGAGVWYRRGNSDVIWSANPVLAGVQTSWHKKSKTMIVIRSRVVQAFLRTALQ